MPAEANTTLTTDIAKALDVEMQERFKHEQDLLARVLGIVTPEVVAAGTAMYVYKVTGELADGSVGEGELVPLSKYKVEKEPIGEIELKKFRKLTTAEAVLKGGVENAVVRTDDKMVKDIRAYVIGRFFGWLNSTAEQFASGATLQAALAQADAVLADELERTGDSAERVVHFMNRFDAADHLAGAEITTQTLFGMTYLENFLGVTDVFLSSQTPKGKVVATPADNIHLYGVDFGSLGAAGLGYNSVVGSLIATKHTPDDNRVGVGTHALTGATLLAEVASYVVEARVGGAADSLSVDELKAFADGRGIELAGKTAKADILAAIQAALPNFR